MEFKFFSIFLVASQFFYFLIRSNVNAIEIILFDDRIAELKEIGRKVRMSLKLQPTDLPCSSFYEYACSKNKTVFPRMGQHLKNGVIKHLVDELAGRGSNFSAKTKALNFFYSCKLYINIDKCYESFFKYFKSLLAYAALTYDMNSYDKHIFNTVKTRFLQAIEAVPEFAATDAKKEIDRKFSIIEKRTEYLSIEELNREFERYQMDAKNYYQNILNLQRNYNSTRDNVHETVVDIALYLHQSHNKPISYFYPSFNIHMWKDLYYDVMQNETILEDVSRCLQLPDSMSTKQKRTVAAYFEAIEASWNEYMEWLDESDLTKKVNEQENLHLRDYNLNTKKIFFIIYAQTFCHLDKNTVDNHLVEGLKHSSEFASSYFCMEGSPMNPEGKCETVV